MTQATQAQATRARATRARRRLARLMDILDHIADDAPRIVTAAEDWAGSLRANNPATGPSSSGDLTYSDPTGNLAGNVPPYALHAEQLLKNLTDLEKAITTLETHGAALATTRLRCLDGFASADQRNEIVELNRTDGLCPTCQDTTCTGKGDDRLRRITTAQGEQQLMCNACRFAWARRGYAAPGELIGYPEFARDRRRSG